MKPGAEWVEQISEDGENSLLGFGRDITTLLVLLEVPYKEIEKTQWPPCIVCTKKYH